MPTLIFDHQSSEEHDMGQGHPERPDRIRAVRKALEAERFKGLERRQAPQATVQQISRVHEQSYVEHLIAAVPEEGLVRIDPDTAMCPASGEAALRAAGAIIGAIDAVMNGDANSAFCAVRPPGHHAEPNQGMGFCLFNNVAIGVQHARQIHNLERVAVVDFDVHHGNGTQAAFWSDPNVLFASSHQYPFYPGTGGEDETGAGNIFNVPLGAGTGSALFRQGMERVVLPALEDFDPDLIIVSAGFDAHARDPLANIRLDEEDFEWITGKLVDVAGEFCDGRIISSLEGGYDLEALENSVSAHLAALMRAQ
ncbi:MAG: acetoin utilization protein [Rhodospirillaceae bacterium]|nr:acetoin utilization protein [Rhodospirillaceae bacterium]|tara:strand:+ start:8498 stop:9427 length:930 start_codon:yes stop_codon:yes gene_type:complete